LLIIAIGLFGEVFVRGRIVVPDDAATTAANLQSMQGLWRAGIAAEYVLLICAVLLTLILSPSLADRLFPVILMPAFVGELSLCLWLLFKGVNAERWAKAPQATTALAD
jgi:hypothetical protein